MALKATPPVRQSRAVDTAFRPNDLLFSSLTGFEALQQSNHNNKHTYQTSDIGKFKKCNSKRIKNPEKKKSITVKSRKKAH